MISALDLVDSYWLPEKPLHTVSEYGCLKGEGQEGPACRQKRGRVGSAEVAVPCHSSDYRLLLDKLTSGNLPSLTPKGHFVFITIIIAWLQLCETLQFIMHFHIYSSYQFYSR